MKVRLAALGLAFGFLLTLAGCVEDRREYTLNPDGSGKVAFRQVAPAPGDQILTALINGSEGVEGWKDLSIEDLGGGSGAATGVAYFSDLSKLKLNKEGDDDGLFDNMVFSGQPDGTITLTFPESDNSSEGQEESQPPPGNMTDEEIEQKVYEKKMELATQRMFMGEVLKTFILEGKFHLPGQIAGATGFETGPGNLATFAIKGNAILLAYDEMLADEELMRRMVVSGAPDAMNEALAEKLLGGIEDPVVTVSGNLSPLFDYKAEVATAMDTSGALDSLEQAKQKAAAPGSQVTEASADGPAGNLDTSAKTRWSTTYSSIGSVSTETKLINVEITVKGPEVAESYMAGKIGISSLKADSGIDLKLEEDFGNDSIILKEIVPAEWPAFERTPDGGLTFKIKLDPEGRALGAINEVSGELTLRSSSSQREIDFPMAGVKLRDEEQLKYGETGHTTPGLREAGLGVDFFKPSLSQKDCRCLIISTQRDAMARIKTVEFLSADGQATALEEKSSSGSGSWYTGGYPIPMSLLESSPEGTLRITLREGITDKVASFKVGPVPVGPAE